MEIELDTTVVRSISQVDGPNAAAAQARGTGVSRAEATELADALREHRNALARVGGNLNQVAAFANSTGGQLLDAAAREVRYDPDQRGDVYVLTSPGATWIDDLTNCARCNDGWPASAPDSSHFRPTRRGPA